MKLVGLVVMAAMATGAWAAEAGRAEVRRVTVCLSGSPKVWSAYPAKSMASEIFSAIGVRLDWRDSSCPVSPDAIKIGFEDQAPKGVSASALAYALPFEGAHIVVLYTRVKQQCPWPQLLLAYVMVHEIAHILEGVTEHSARGIMKARWVAADYYNMLDKSLAFTPEDVETIYRGMDARPVWMAAKARVQVAAR